MQGCPFRCYNCFNPETWNFNGGKEWDEEVENQFIELAKRPYIKRISILGGEPLADKNLQDVLNLVNKIRLLFGNSKSIWLYSGYSWEDIWEYNTSGTDLYGKHWRGWTIDRCYRQDILRQCDVFVDGRYIDEIRDITLHWRGSSNQRVVDVQQSFKEQKMILYDI